MRHRAGKSRKVNEELGLTKDQLAHVRVHQRFSNRMIALPPSWGLSVKDYKALIGPVPTHSKTAYAIFGASSSASLGGLSVFAVDSLAPAASLAAGVSIVSGIVALFSGGVSVEHVTESIAARKTYNPKRLLSLDPNEVIEFAPFGAVGTLLYFCYREEKHQQQVYDLALKYRDELARIPRPGQTDLGLVSALYEETRELVILAKEIGDLDHEIGAVVTLMTLVREGKDEVSRPDPGGLWTLARSRHREVSEAWDQIITDPFSALDHSSLLDVTQARTAAFLTAYGEAQDFILVHGESYPGAAQVQAYLKLVRVAEAAWTEAYRYSEQVGLAWLSSEDQSTMVRVRKLLALASNESATVAERAAAAGQATKLLDSFQAFTLPLPAITALEAYSRLALTPKNTFSNREALT